MKLGVIGVGNMGAAIIKGCIASGMKPENIFGTGRDPRRTAAFAEETGIQLWEDIGDLVTKCDAVMIAVKPKDGLLQKERIICGIRSAGILDCRPGA